MFSIKIFYYDIKININIIISIALFFIKYILKY